MAKYTMAPGFDKTMTEEEFWEKRAETRSRVRAARARSYCFTVNNYAYEDLMAFLDIECKYKCFGFEEGENGTPHIQGYVQFRNPTSFLTMKRCLPRAHIEIAKGTPAQNIEYCSKDGDFHEFGDRPHEGGAKGKKTTEEILAELEDPMNNLSTVRQYARTVEVAKALLLKQRKRETKFYVHVPIGDAITEILEYFDGVPDWTIIENLCELGFYEDPKNVIYMPYICSDTSFDTRNLWPRGKPILYKYGYEYREIKPDRFVFVTDDHRGYPLYKRI